MSRHMGKTQYSIEHCTRDEADFLVIGNGIAGMTAAFELRRLVPAAKIVVITDQNYPTISAPGLKNFAVGRVQRNQLLAFPNGSISAHSLVMVNGHVHSIDAVAHTVSLADEQGVYTYKKLFLATGSEAIPLPVQLPGHDLDGVIKLHRLPHYVDLRRRLVEVQEAVVVGGGLQAAETALALASLHIDVHWLLRGTTFLSKVLDETVSERVLSHVQQAGVTLHRDTQVLGVQGNIGMVTGVVTHKHERIPCQLVATCIGTRPNVGIVTRSNISIRLQQGIVVNDHLQTNIQDIFALGDVAAIWDENVKNYNTRAQWYEAAIQGKVAAAAALGHPLSIRATLGSRWVATTLGGLYLLAIGDTVGGPGRTMHVKTGSEMYHRLTLEHNRLVGFLSLSAVQEDTLAIKRLVDERCEFGIVQEYLYARHFDEAHYHVGQDNSTMQHLLHATFSSPAYPLQNSWQGEQRTSRNQTDQLADAYAAYQTRTHGAES